MVKAEILVDKEEIDRYEEAVKAFMNNEIDPDRFMALRLQHGMYGQRQDGVHMVRTKIPGGKLTVDQLEALADVTDQYSGDDYGCVTTRQDIQIHYVPLKDTPAVMRRLGEGGMTSREACGNTIRNITACALAGECPRAHTDITPFFDAVTERFLRHPLTQHLPRKMKFSFSACEADCALGMIHDIGAIAIQKEGKFGFKIVAAGGLGIKPHKAITIEEFIEEKDLLPCFEAVIALHSHYSDRTKRSRSRVKFLVDKFGEAEFIAKYKEEFARTQTAFSDQSYPTSQWQAGKECEAFEGGAPRQIFPQKQSGLSVIPIRLNTGDFKVSQMRGIAELMKAENLSDLRTTIGQNLMLVNVPDERVNAVLDNLKALDLGIPETGDDIVSCPGTTTCRLGITSSKLAAKQISGSQSDLRVRISGCHNSCAQHHIADIGAHGEGKRRHGKLIPHYMLHIAGNGTANGTIALKGPAVPTLRVKTAIERIESSYEKNSAKNESFFDWAHKKGTDYFIELVSDLSEVAPEEVANLAKDYGDEDSFKLTNFGGGECAGAAQEIVSANFAEAAHERNYRNAFLLQRKYTESIECAEELSRLIGESLLFMAGEKGDDNSSALSTAKILKDSAHENSIFGAELEKIATTLAELQKEFNQELFDTINKELDHWTTRAAEACQKQDQQLDLRASLPAQAKSGVTTSEIDLSNFGCPLHYIKARNALKEFQSGDIVIFLLDSGESATQVSGSLENDGHEILSVNTDDEAPLIKIRKG